MRTVLSTLLIASCAACGSSEATDSASGLSDVPTTPVAGAADEGESAGNAAETAGTAPGGAVGTPGSAGAGGGATPGDAALDGGTAGDTDGGTDGGTPDGAVDPRDAGPASNPECPGLGADAFAPRDAGANTFDRAAEGLRALRDEAEASRALFEERKATEGDDYVYTMSFSSVFGGGCSTEIEVRDGVVVRRTQTLTLSDGSGAGASETETWTEEGDQLGTHQGCHLARTLDQVYAECLDQVLCQDPADNYLSLETFDDGLLMLCSFFPRNCADDCSEGPNLTAIEWL